MSEFNVFLFSSVLQLSQFGADIGGTIGLWLGFTIFTAVELVDLLVQTCFYFGYTKQMKEAKQARARYAAQQQQQNPYGPYPRSQPPPPPNYGRVPPPGVHARQNYGFAR